MATELDNHRGHDRLCHSLPNAGQLNYLPGYRVLLAALALSLDKRMHPLVAPASKVPRLVRDEFRVLN